MTPALRLAIAAREAGDLDAHDVAVERLLRQRAGKLAWEGERGRERRLLLEFDRMERDLLRRLEREARR